MNFRTQMDITTIRRSLFTLTTLILSVGVHAQKDRTKEGYALNWDKPIVVVADSISNGTHRLPAWTVSIFETDANTVLDLWRTDMKAISLGVSGKKPLKASGVTIADLGSGLMVMAQASTDKKAKLVQVHHGIRHE
ncbi:MAG: hypothetical protein IPI81_07050 [Flavobacteriales bacterium]|nr:hypothetical protein [Flavobacteriales bacterium]